MILSLKFMATLFVLFTSTILINSVNANQDFNDDNEDTIDSSKPKILFNLKKLSHFEIKCSCCKLTIIFINKHVSCSLYNLNMYCTYAKSYPFTETVFVTPYVFKHGSYSCRKGITK